MRAVRSRRPGYSNNSFVCGSSGRRGGGGGGAGFLLRLKRSFCTARRSVACCCCCCAAAAPCYGGQRAAASALLRWWLRRPRARPGGPRLACCASLVAQARGAAAAAGERHFSRGISGALQQQQAAGGRRRWRLLLLLARPVSAGLGSGVVAAPVLRCARAAGRRGAAGSSVPEPARLRRRRGRHDACRRAASFALLVSSDFFLSPFLSKIFHFLTRSPPPCTRRGAHDRAEEQRSVLRRQKGAASMIPAA